MSDILTVTMNPALDVSTSTGKVVDTHKLRCMAASRNRAARPSHRLPRRPAFAA